MTNFNVGARVYVYVNGSAMQGTLRECFPAGERSYWVVGLDDGTEYGAYDTSLQPVTSSQGETTESQPAVDLGAVAAAREVRATPSAAAHEGGTGQGWLVLDVDGDWYNGTEERKTCRVLRLVLKVQPGNSHVDGYAVVSTDYDSDPYDLKAAAAMESFDDWAPDFGETPEYARVPLQAVLCECGYAIPEG